MLHFFIESYNWSMPIHYQPSGVLWIYGDSLAVRFSESVNSRFLCTSLYLGCRRSYNWIYPIISETVGKQEDDNLDFQPREVIETITSVLRRPEMQRKDSVLLLNLGLHFPISINFTTYQRFIGDVINTLKETEVNLQGIRVPKYKAKVIWKSTTAIHKENAEVKNKTNWRFFTTQVFIKHIQLSSQTCIPDLNKFTITKTETNLTYNRLRDFFKARLSERLEIKPTDGLKLTTNYQFTNFCF